MTHFIMRLKAPEFSALMDAHMAELFRRYGEQWEDLKVNIGWASDEDWIASKVAYIRREIITTRRTTDGRIVHTAEPY